MPRKQRTFLPQTQAAIDSLLARVLRTESLAGVGVALISLIADLQSEEMISSGAAGVALVLGRCLVKRGGK